MTLALMRDLLMLCSIGLVLNILFYLLLIALVETGAAEYLDGFLWA